MPLRATSDPVRAPELADPAPAPPAIAVADGGVRPGTGGHLVRLLPVAWLLLLCLVDFATLLLPGPWGRQFIAAGDFSRQFYPFQVYAAARLAQGQLPLWDPYILGGQAHLADPQTALFFPVGLLVDLVAGRQGLPYLALEWRAAIDVALGALFSYLFVTRLTNSRVGGVAGATVFCFGGYLTSYPLPQLPVLEASVWLPLVLYGLERGLTGWAERGRGTPWFLLAGAAGAVLLLAGHGQTALFAAYASGAYALVRWYALRRPALPTAAQLVLAGLLAAGLSAPQWLPTLAYLPVTNRLALGYAAASGGFRLPNLAQLVTPGGFFLRSFYIGLLPLALGLVALRWRAAWGWALLWLLAALASLGGNGPFYPLLYAHLPGFASFRDQERAAYLATLAAAVLAGYGAARVMGWAKGSAHPSTRYAAWGVALAAVALTIAGAILLRAGAPPADDPAFVAPLHKNVAAAVVLAIAAVLVPAAASRHLLRPAPAAFLLCLLPAINLLGANGTLGRTAANPVPTLPPAAAAYLHAQPGLFRVDTLRDDELPRNAGAMLDLSFPRGDDPLVIRRSADLAGQPGRYAVWRLFNVQYVLSRQDPGQGFARVAQGDGFGVFQMQYSLPRAWAVRDVALARTPAEALRATLVLAQPGARVVLEGEPSLPMVGPALPRDQRETWLEAGPERLRLDVMVTDNAVLVISQPAAPGWHATVDGRPATLLPADYAFIALELPAGEHRITLEYRPAGLLLGLAAAVMAALLGVGALVWTRRR